MKPLRVALVHDWLVNERGGEQVLARLCRLFDGADIFTLVYDANKMGPTIRAHRIVESALGHYRRATGRFRHLLPLFPLAVERFDLSAYDLVISTSHCVAHGVVTGPEQLHISYIHTPMRYVYDQLPHYLPRGGRSVLEPAARFLSWPLRRWDRRAARRSDVLIANSAFVAGRIERVWQRKSHVIYPPVEVKDVIAQSRVAERRRPREGLIFVGALVPYKRADLAVALAARLQIKLTVVGSGSEEQKLRRMAPPWVRFVSGITRPALIELLAQSEAMVYPGEEDFGIAPVEALAAGLSVLGVAHGGLKETIVGHGPHAGGILCAEASVAALAEGFEALRAQRARRAFLPETLRQHAERFCPERFDKEVSALVAREIAARPALAARLKNDSFAQHAARL